MPARSPVAAACSPTMYLSRLYHSKNAVLPAKVLLFLITSFSLGSCHRISPAFVSFSQSASEIQAYDFVEVTAKVSLPHASNPFTDAEFSGWFEPADHSRRWQVEGFCDSLD